MVGKECEEEMNKNRTWDEIIAEDLTLCAGRTKMIAEKERELSLTIAEVRSIVQEFSNQFISRENPLCEATVYKMIRFLMNKEKEDARKSQDH